MERTQRNERRAEIVHREIDRHPIKTQEDCCLIGARVSVAMGDIPANESEFLAAAHGAAKGLFGPAFEKADDAQKWTWIDMCEAALRQAVTESRAASERSDRAL